MSGFMLWWATGSLLIGWLLTSRTMMGELRKVAAKRRQLHPTVRLVVMWATFELLALAWPYTVGLIIYGILQSRRKP